MEMFTCLTKRIARHLPGYRQTDRQTDTQCRILFYPTIKVNLLSGNFLLLFYFSFIPFVIVTCSGGGCLFVCNM